MQLRFFCALSLWAGATWRDPCKLVLHLHPGDTPLFHWVSVGRPLHPEGLAEEVGPNPEVPAEKGQKPFYSEEGMQEKSGPA